MNTGVIIILFETIRRSMLCKITTDLLDVIFLDNAYLPFRMCLLAQAAVFTMRYFYGSACSKINDTVTSLGNNIHNGINIGVS